MAAVAKPCRKCGVIFVGKYCKPCDNARSAARRKADPKRASAQTLEWKRRNKERVRDLNRASYERNRESIAIKAKAFRKANRERLDAYNRAYETVHPDVRRKIWRRASKKRAEQLTDTYVRLLLRMNGVPAPQALIETKRVIVQIKRLAKDMK